MESANGRGGMSKEGGRTGRTHLLVGETGLLMAGTLTSVPVHNAVALSTVESAETSPAERHQESREEGW